MLFLMMLINEIIPKKIDYIDKTNYIVIVSSDNCVPCKILEAEWITTKKLQENFTSVVVIENPVDKKTVFKNTIIDHQNMVPAIMIYRYEGKMELLSKSFGYSKESFNLLVEKYKNVKESKLEKINWIPKFVEEIFGKSN